REAFGTEDLRAWAGAIPDPRRGVTNSVANILAAPFLPKDPSVAGLVLDDATGALDVVVKPGEIPAAEPRVAETTTTLTPATGSSPISAPGSALTPELGGAEPGKSLRARDPLHDAVRTFVETLQGSARWRGDIRTLKQELAAQKNPMAKLELLEKFARRAGTE